MSMMDCFINIVIAFPALQPNPKINGKFFKMQTIMHHFFHSTFRYFYRYKKSVISHFNDSIKIFSIYNKEYIGTNIHPILVHGHIRMYSIM